MRIWRCFSCSAASASEEEEGGGNMRIWCCSIRSSFMLMSSFEMRLGTGPATQGGGGGGGGGVEWGYTGITCTCNTHMRRVMTQTPLCRSSGSVLPGPPAIMAGWLYSGPPAVMYPLYSGASLDALEALRWGPPPCLEPSS